MSNKQIQAINTDTVVGSFTQSELDTLKATIAKGTTNEQFALFVQTCARSGLNPFLNQIYCITYNGKDGPVMSIQIAVEGIVALAKRHPQYKGFIAHEVKQNDEFEIDVVTGEPKHRIISMDRGKTVGAYCVAYREGAPNITVVITNDQVDHLVKGRNGQMWRDYFDDMIVKHAIKRAFKRQFGIEVAEDEYGVAGGDLPAYDPPARKDITVEANMATAAQPKQEQALPSGSESSQGGDQQPQPEAEIVKDLAKQIAAKLKQLGIPVGRTEEARKAQQDYYAEIGAKFKDVNKPTVAELRALVKLLDQQIEMKQLAEQDELPI